MQICPDIAFAGEDVGINVDPAREIVSLTGSEMNFDAATARGAQVAVEKAVGPKQRSAERIKKALIGTLQHVVAKR